MLVREQNNAKSAFESRYCRQGNLLYASQNKSKSFQSNRLLEGVKDIMDALVILVAGSANRDLSSVLKRQLIFVRLWLCNFICCTL